MGWSGIGSDGAQPKASQGGTPREVEGPLIENVPRC